MNSTSDRTLLLSNGSLENTTIVDLDGEDLGTLDEIMLHVDRERLENTPGFAKDAWPRATDDTWMSDVHQHYGATYQPRDASRQERGSDRPVPTGTRRCAHRLVACRHSPTGTLRSNRRPRAVLFWKPRQYV